MACNFLGYCLTMRFAFTHHLEDVDEALRFQEQAIALAASQPEEYIGYLQNLHNILTERYNVNPTMEDQKRIWQVEEEIGRLKRE